MTTKNLNHSSLRLPSGYENALPRKAKKQAISGTISEAITRGCPQGPSLGPILWLIIMKNWFNKTEEIVVRYGLQSRVTIQVFADGQSVMVKGNTNAEIKGNLGQHSESL